MSLLDLAAQPQTVHVIHPLPHWADKRLHGEYELYAQLATKVGKRAGNGVIVYEHVVDVSAKARIYSFEYM